MRVFLVLILATRARAHRIAVIVTGRTNCVNAQLAKQIAQSATPAHVYLSSDVDAYRPPYTVNFSGILLQNLPSHVLANTPWCVAHGCTNMLSQFFHNARAFDMVAASGVSYDAVLKFRADIGVDRLPRIDFPVPEGTLFVPYGHDYGPEQLNDQVAWGTQATIEKYVKTFYTFPSHHARDRIDNGPEKATYWNAYLQRLRVVRTQYDYELIDARHEPDCRATF